MNKDKEWLLEKIKENSRMPAVIVFDEYQYYVKETDVKKWIGMLNEPKLSEIPQFVADWIKECKTRKHNLFGVYQFAPELVSVWIFENESKKERVDLIARVWLGGYTIQPEENMQVIFKLYDNVERKIFMPESEARKLIDKLEEDQP